MRITSGIGKDLALSSPKGTTTRPTSAKVRAAIGNILQPQLSGIAVLDLFAGTGSVGLELLSRGAESCVFVEWDKAAHSALKKNLAEFSRRTGQSQKTHAPRSRVESFLETNHNHFDVIWLDPPYAKVEAFLGTHAQTLVALLKPGGELFLECGSQMLWPNNEMELVKEYKYGGTKILRWRKS